MIDLKASIREVPDFPKPGILFYDITPLLQSPEVFQATIDRFEKSYKDQSIDAVAAIESRGFIFGAPLAERLNCSLIPIRKPNKLPYKTYSEEYSLEYGKDRLEIHQDAVQPGDRVLIIDDLMATGGTARAAAELIEQCGGKVAELAFLIELVELQGRKHLEGYQVSSLLQY